MTNGAKLSLIMISLTILLMAALLSGVIKSEHWEITDIDVKAEFKRVSSEQIRLAVASYPQRSFFNVKAQEIRNNLLNIPWVQDVSVNKKWPDKLIITIIEHQAVAVWNDDKLLNENGKIFAVDSIDDLSALPQIQAQAQDSQLVWDKLIRYNDIINPTGLDIKTAQISQRSSWNLLLSNGIQINLGSQKMDAKLVRLADTWENLLKNREVLPEYIDLRYTNGYVVKWKKSNNNLKHIQAQMGNEKING